MTDKLDFSGFDAPAATPPVPEPPRRKAKSQQVTTRRRVRAARKATTRRKRRVNVSLAPAVSEAALETAGKRGLTLSDLVRAAYREKAHLLDASRFASSVPAFSPAAAAAPGRVVHMLYLTAEEVDILDRLAARFESSRSGVIGALLAG